jgi:hypothetical protein
VSGVPAENGIVLETEERARLVADLLTQLAAAIPGSTALPRGSLAERSSIQPDVD